MSAERPIVIAGAGIGGLTAALALARAGHSVIVLEAAPRLEEAGAGLQLSPNASRVLLALGLGEALREHVVVPSGVTVRRARSGRDIVSIPFDPAADGAPYWLIHRADLQSVLLAAVAAEPSIVLRLGTELRGYSLDGPVVTVAARTRSGVMLAEIAGALIGADGLRSTVRRSLDPAAMPRFARRSAWRALVPAIELAPAWRQGTVRLWLGANAHLVHYPVRGGAFVNIVAVLADPQPHSGWTEPGTADELTARFRRWSPAARELLAAPSAWQRWSLYDLPALPAWGQGPLTLLGDAAHAMLPFMAQGAAMAIEDAAVLAACVAQASGDIPAALRRYESIRQPRTHAVARAAARTGTLYHLRGPLAAARNLGMRMLGGARLAERQRWVYDWRPE